MSEKHICQVAFCALNAAQLRDWYRDVFGMVQGGGLLLTAPPMPTYRIQGISPNPAEKVTWLVDQQDYFQLEFFQYYRPRSKLKPAGWQPCDIGYNMVGIFARDFDRVLARAAAHSDRPIPPPVGPPGERRVCIQDPEGNWVEIMERDPLCGIEGTDPCIVRPELLSATRFMRVSVPDLEQSCQSFITAMGLSEVTDFALHTPEHEALWGLPGAQANTVLLRGRNFLVELVQYDDPAPRLRPAGYQICDQGFMNIAIGYDSPGEFDREFAHATRHGMQPNGKPVDTGLFRVMYVNDPQGFSVEMLHARKALWSLSGFNVGEPYVENEMLIRAPVEKTWGRLIDHAGLGSWTLFDSAVLRPGNESPNGPGCLRELRAFGLRITEEVVDWEEGRHYGYRLRTGAPFRWHRGDLFVSEENGGTRVRWAIRFESRIPFTGRITAWCLGLVFRRALKQLQRQLEAA
jgi:catechol 2,3-dioxygenase-like lactoylglutathione lyase family enzyme